MLTIEAETVLRHELRHVVCDAFRERPSSDPLALTVKLNACDEVVDLYKRGKPLDEALFYSFSGYLLDVMLSRCAGCLRAVDRATEAR